MSDTREAFKALRARMIEAMTQTAEVLQEVYGDEAEVGRELPQNLLTRANALRREEFSVVVVGEMKRGKSTFMNALLQRQVFATDVLEATATVGFMRHNDLAARPEHRDHAVVHFQDGREPQGIELERLVHYTTKQSELGSKTVADTVHHVDVFVDSPFVEDGVVLVDTPGTNSTHETHMAITYRQIDVSDAAIFLLNANTGFSASDRAFFRDMQDKIRHFFFVANRMDEIPSGQEARVLASVEEKLREELGVEDGPGPRVYAISALKALLGRHGYLPSAIVREDEAARLDDQAFRDQLIATSNLVPLERDLIAYLFQGGKSRDILLAPLHFLEGVVREAQAFLRQQEEVLAGTFDFEKFEREESELVRAVGERKAELERTSDELVKRLDRALQDGLEEVRGLLEAEEAALRDFLGNFPTLRQIKENWDQNAGLETYPIRRIEAVQRKVSRVLVESVRVVLEAEHRKLRGQLAEQLADLKAFQLTELPTVAFNLHTPEVAPEEAEALQRASRPSSRSSRPAHGSSKARRRHRPRPNWPRSEASGRSCVTSESAGSRCLVSGRTWSRPSARRWNTRCRLA